MSDDLIKSLLALAAGRHDDPSVAVDAVIEIRRQRAEIERMTRERDEARADVERLRTGLDRLARLGNEPNYGNTFGNRLARQVLEGKP